MNTESIQTKTNKKGVWINIANIITGVTVFLLPILFLPIQYIDFLSTKAGLLIFGFSISVLIWAITKLVDGSFNLPTNLISLSLILLPLTYLLSAVFSDNFSVATLGRDLGYDSVIVFSFLFLILFYVAFNFKDRKKSVYLNLVIFSSIFIVLIFHLIRLVFLPSFPTFNFFFDPSSNTLGRWYDLGTIAGLGVIISITSLELFNFSKAIKGFLFALLSVSVLSLAVVGFQTIWAILGIVSIIIFVYVITLNKNKENKKVLPVTSLVTFLVSFIFIIGGNNIYGLLHPVFNVSFFEVRPSLGAHIEVTQNVFRENLLFGSGPGTFNRAWNTHKPENFNLTEMWNVNFRYGYSTVTTFFVMGGLVHTLAWLFFFAMYFYYGFKSLFIKTKDEISEYVTVSSFVSSLFMWIVSVFYVHSFVNIALTFILTGIFIGSLYRENQIKLVNIDITKNSKAGFIYMFSVVALLLLIITGIWHFSIRTAAAHLHRTAIISFNRGDIILAEDLLVRANLLHLTDSKIQDSFEIGLINLNEVLSRENISDEDRAMEFRAVLRIVISNMQLAIGYDPMNYQNYVLLGNLFETLIPFGIEGAYEEALASYQRAQELNPRNPSIVLNMARTEFAIGNNQEARELISKALDLKGNFTQAIFLLSQIDVSEDNIDQAIANVSVAAQIRPNDPVVFFQLGILRYQDGNFTGAASAFDTALSLNPAYDNARYFFGLSLYRINQVQEAANQFEILAQRYPNNEEISFILNNLRNGQSPFAGTEVPIDEAPESRDVLPIDEDEIVDSSEIIE